MILLTLVIIILVIIFLIVISKNSITDVRTQLLTNGLNIKFLNKKEGSSIINSITYFDHFNISDYKARGLDHSKDVRKWYCDRILEFDEEHKLSLQWLAKSINDKLPEKYRFLLNSLTICMLDDSLERGFPHTHKDCIFFSKRILDRLKSYRFKNNIDMAIKNIGITLIHEQVHVLQREYPNLFKKLYTYYWTFIYNNKPIEGIDKYLDINRTNPDGTDLSWILDINNKKILILSPYKLDTKIHLGNVDIIGIYLKDNGRVMTIEGVDDLVNIDEYRNYYNLYINHYHPNEISAELISLYYGYLLNVNKIDIVNPAMKQLVLWFDNINLIKDN